MKAIETKYKGYRFRSRLEARWAMFFDAIGFPWEYEPEGFELSDGTRYLPDFRLFGHIWYEIKPETVTEDPKVKTFNHDSFDHSTLEVFQEFCTLLSGDPLHWLKNHWICSQCGHLDMGADWNCEGPQTREVYCFYCDSHQGENDPVRNVSAIPTEMEKGNLQYWGLDAKRFLNWQSWIRDEALVVRGARFEFGEKG